MNKYIVLAKKYKLKLFTTNRSLNKLRFKYPDSYFAKYLAVDIRNWDNVDFGNNVQIHNFTVISLMDDKKNPNHKNLLLK